MPPAVSGSVFVYPLPSHLAGEHLYDNITENDHDYHFRGELELTQRLRNLPQAPPDTADMLLVPFMLVQAFTKLRKGLRSPGHAELMRWDAKVVAWLRAYGPYWDNRRANHAIFSQRCAGPPSDRLRKASIAVNTWPSLWESNATLLCFEPATLTHMGRGILLPYGVGHGAGGRRCPGTAAVGSSSSAHEQHGPSKHNAHLHGGGVDGVSLRHSAPRPSLLLFAGSVATNTARRAWVEAMRTDTGLPPCKLVLFEKASRKQPYRAGQLEETLKSVQFSLQLRGHVGPRKAIFDSIRCGALPLLASERSPMPFADEIEYSEFALRVPESANASKVIALLRQRYAKDEKLLRRMRQRMAHAAQMLDYGPHGGLGYAVLARFARVARGSPPAVPASTKTPLPLLDVRSASTLSSHGRSGSRGPRGSAG